MSGRDIFRLKSATLRNLDPLNLFTKRKSDIRSPEIPSKKHDDELYKLLKALENQEDEVESLTINHERTIQELDDKERKLLELVENVRTKKITLQKEFQIKKEKQLESVSILKEHLEKEVQKLCSKESMQQMSNAKRVLALLRTDKALRDLVLKSEALHELVKFVAEDKIQLPNLVDLSMVDKEMIDKGGFGIVYKATFNGEMYALKQLSPSTDLDHEGSHKMLFKREIALMSLLEHPNIAPCIGADFTSTISYIMPLYPLGSLKRLILRQPELLTPRLIFKILFDVANGLQYLHQCDVLHRDLKPDNLMMLDHQVAPINTVIVDFGIARVTSLTITRGAMGSLLFMAPEIAESTTGHQKASDIFAFGIIMWMIWTHKVAPNDLYPTVPEVLVPNHVKQGSRPAVPKDCPPWYSSLMQRCWAQHVADRPKANQVFAEMQQICQPFLPLSDNQESSLEDISTLWVSSKVFSSLNWQGSSIVTYQFSKYSPLKFVLCETENGDLVVSFENPDNIYESLKIDPQAKIPNFEKHALEIPTALFFKELSKRKRMYFTGMGLGASIAILVTLRVLNAAEKLPDVSTKLRCVTFSPLLGIRSHYLEFFYMQDWWTTVFQHFIYPDDYYARIFAVLETLRMQTPEAEDLFAGIESLSQTHQDLEVEEYEESLKIFLQTFVEKERQTQLQFTNFGQYNLILSSKRIKQIDGKEFRLADSIDLPKRRTHLQDMKRSYGQKYRNLFVSEGEHSLPTNVQETSKWSSNDTSKRGLVSLLVTDDTTVLLIRELPNLEAATLISIPALDISAKPIVAPDLVKLEFPTRRKKFAFVNMTITLQTNFDQVSWEIPVTEFLPKKR